MTAHPAGCQCRGMYGWGCAQENVICVCSDPGWTHGPELHAYVAAVRDRAVAKALAGVRTHNGTPVTAKNLRWAATHEAFIYDVLMGLAAALPAEPEGEA